MSTFEVVGGGVPTAEEAAAIAAALAVVLSPEPDSPALNRWRWSGRWWDQPPADWRDPGSPAHPCAP